MATGTVLKRSSLGDIVRIGTGSEARIVRELGAARPGCRWLARYLARREARMLERLRHLDRVPRLIAIEPHRLIRSSLEGEAMHIAAPPTRAWFRQALGLVRRMHQAGLTHNDLAKEANWLCLTDGSPGLVDFQLATALPRRGRLFRLLAREDLRHLLKHKARYQPAAMTRRQRELVAEPSVPARLFRLLFKPVYRFVTRRLLGWPERTDARERQRPHSAGSTSR